MSDDYKYYIVYRMDPDGKGHAYGWTFNKKILKSFLSQRDPKKYKAKRSSYEELAQLFSEQSNEHDVYDIKSNFAIDWISLISNQTGEEVKLFMTEMEVNEVEKSIRKMFRDASALDCIPGDKYKLEDYVMMVVNLKEKYMEALEQIGFRPKELDAIFDSIEETYLIDTTDFNRDTGAYYEISAEELYRGCRVEDMNRFNRIFDKVVWSLESFIRVMKDDL
jgi:hypothetical protein